MPQRNTFRHLHRPVDIQTRSVYGKDNRGYHRVLGRAKTRRVQKPVRAARSSGDRDDRLMARVRSGDETALETLMGYHDDLVRSIFLRCGVNPSDVSDLQQETWIRVYNPESTYRPQKQFRAWLFRVAQRVLFAYIDSQRTDALSLRVEAESRVSSPDLAQSAVILSEIDAALNGSPKRHA